MAKPDLVVSRREIAPVVSPAAFFSPQGAHDDRFGDLEQALQFQRMNQVGVKDASLILYAQVLRATFQGVERV